MEIVLFGVNHKTAPVAMRERLAIVESRLADRLAALRAHHGVTEAVILSTCNRSEFYVAGEDGKRATQGVLEYLTAQHQVPADAIQHHHYHLINDQVARHLFTVSCGLDSMIPGEGQILSQVRKAFLLAQESKATGSVFNKLFPWAVKVGKRARTETRISQGAASIGFAAVELAKRVCGELDGRHAVIVGAGKMGELTLKLLVHSGVRQLSVVNRTWGRAEALAQRIGAQPHAFDRLPELLATADIVVFSTGAPGTVLSREELIPIMRRRKWRPLFLVDIAVPRDVDPTAGELENVYLYNVDDLQNLVADNVEERRHEMARVEAIVGEELQEFRQYFNALRAVPVIRALRSSFEDVRQHELEATFSKNHITPEEKKRLETFSYALLQKLLHGPTTRLKSLAQKPDVMDALMEIFSTPDEDAQ
ncbi:MAG: glutamyl-tRNA reductase [Candidatus Xenobia bacterium]